MRKLAALFTIFLFVSLPYFNGSTKVLNSASASTVASPQAGAFYDLGYINMFRVQRLPGGTIAVAWSGGHMKSYHNIRATIAEVPTYEGCEPLGTDYLAPADAASVIASNAANSGFKLMLNLQWVLFERVTYPCAPNTPTRLRANWDQRLTTYAQRAGGNFNSSNTAYMIIHSEVNNSPQVLQSNIITVTNRAKQLFPGIPAVAGYPTSDGAGPLPLRFADPLDIIFTWDYNVPDPNAASYVNGDYAALTSRLRGHQSVGVLLEGFGNRTTGISGVYLGTLARRWCQFAKNQGWVQHIVGFFWGEDGLNDGGTDDIIHYELGLGTNGIESAHRAVAAAALNMGNGSCWAP